MKYYTNIYYNFDEILAVENVNGKKDYIREKFNPSVFLPSRTKTNYKYGFTKF